MIEYINHIDIKIGIRIFFFFLIFLFRWFIVAIANLPNTQGD